MYTETFALACAIAIKLVDPDTAEDIAARVCDAVLKRLAENPATFQWSRALVARVTKRVVINHHKAHKRRGVHETEYEERRVHGVRRKMDPRTSQYARESGRRRADALNELSPAVRSDWLRVREDGYSLDEAAEERRVKKQTVKCNLGTARSALAEDLAAHRGDAFSDDEFLVPPAATPRAKIEGEPKEAE